MSLISLDSVIQLGQDTIALKYYSIANTTILFYDYLLTLEDEIKYAWSGKGSRSFWIFLLNRYFPVLWLFWQFTVTYAPQSKVATEVCNHTSFYPLFVILVCSLIAQSVLTARMYAVTMKNLPITFCFAAITIAQFVLGVAITVLAGRTGAQPQAPIPLDAYHVCVFSRSNRQLEIAYTSLSLFYDGLAFLLVTLWARKSKVQGLYFATILDTIAEDATWYFMVIFTSHFVLVMTLNLGRPAIQLLPGVGILIYLPVMISRIMLSLKKAADPTKRTWGLMEQTTYGPTVQGTLKFTSPRMGGNWEKGDLVPLDMLQDST